MRAVFIIAAGVAVGYGIHKAAEREIFVPTLDADSVPDTVSAMLSTVAHAFNFVGSSNMRNVDRSLVNHPNVRAILNVIRAGESSRDPVGYKMLCGGGTFSSFADHPRPTLPRPCSRGASGAYQIIVTTWDWVRGVMALPDFTPGSQDLAALGLIAYRGALPAVLAGDLPTAISKLRNEWTSLPGAAENQFMTMEKAAQIFANSGGTITRA